MYKKFDKVLRWSMSVLLMVAMLVVAARLATGEWKENMPATARNVKTDDTRRKEQKLVVLDPGHGGNDPGKVGINGAYEKNTGTVIVETFEKQNLNYEYCPAVLVSQHAPFVWGKTPAKAVENAFVLERVAQMNILTNSLSDLTRTTQMDQVLLERHFYRKHGATAYYGQK